MHHSVQSTFSLIVHGHLVRNRARYPLSCNLHLALHHRPTGSTDRVPLLDARLEIKDLHDIFGEMRRQIFPLIEGEVGNLALGGFGERDCAT